MASSAQRRAQMEVAVWARQRVRDPRTVFLDTETTGLGAEAEIIDLAIVGIDGSVLLDTLIAPIDSIPPASTAVHGIEDVHVVGAPGWIEVYPKIADLLRERSIVVYNAEFDRRMIAGCCARHGLHLEQGEWHCAMQRYAHFAGVRSDHHRNRFRFHSLGNALAAFGLPSGTHRALSDAIACRSLVLALAGLAPPD